MKVAVVGSRTVRIQDLDEYLPRETREIISGGARGVDADARIWAHAHNIPLTEILPRYETYGRAAPLRRNDEIISCADFVLAFWDGESRGTKYVIDRCRRLGKPCCVIISETLSVPEDGSTRK